jgi:hypothetical protein
MGNVNIHISTAKSPSGRKDGKKARNKNGIILERNVAKAGT